MNTILLFPTPEQKINKNKKSLEIDPHDLCFVMYGFNEQLGACTCWPFFFKKNMMAFGHLILIATAFLPMYSNMDVSIMGMSSEWTYPQSANEVYM